MNTLKYIDEYYGTEINTLKSEFQQLLEKFEQLEQYQNNVIDDKLQLINKDISILKRNTNKITFEDLIDNVNEN